MPKIVVVLALAFALLGAASPAMARPGVSSGGPADQARYAQCFDSTLATMTADAAKIRNAGQRARRVAEAQVAADATCQPRPDNPRIPLSQPFVVPPGLAGTAIVSCDALHQFDYRGKLYSYRAGDPSITGDTGITTGGPYPYTVSAESTGPVGGYNDAYYWRINNTTGRPTTLIMHITCQRPTGF
jgi:hypothetical protein